MPLSRISEVVSVGKLLGEQVKVREKKGKDIVVWGVRFQKGMKDQDYAVVQCFEPTKDGEIDKGRPFWFTCGAANLVDALRRAENLLPLLMRVDEVKSKGGRMVLTIE